MKEAIKLVANNKKAYHDYFIDEKFECGIELFGTEVKSIRLGKLNLKDSYILTPDKLRTAKWDLAILHPLPRVNEISIAIDDDPRACYFRQVLCGKFIRMALILKLLEVE